MIRAPASQVVRLPQQPHESALEDAAGRPLWAAGWGAGAGPKTRGGCGRSVASRLLPSFCPPTRGAPVARGGWGRGGGGHWASGRKRLRTVHWDPSPHGSKTAAAFIRWGRSSVSAPPLPGAEGTGDAPACVLPRPPPSRFSSASFCDQVLGHARSPALALSSLYKYCPETCFAPLVTHGVTSQENRQAKTTPVDCIALVCTWTHRDWHSHSLRRAMKLIQLPPLPLTALQNPKSLGAGSCLSCRRAPGGKAAGSNCACAVGSNRCPKRKQRPRECPLPCSLASSGHQGFPRSPAARDMTWGRSGEARRRGVGRRGPGSFRPGREGDALECGQSPGEQPAWVSSRPAPTAP